MRHGAGVVTYLARYLRGGPIKNAPPRGVRRRARHLHLSRPSGGGRRRAPWAPADDVARRGLSPALAAACADAPDAGRAVVWAVPSQPRCGPGRLSCGAWPAADGGASSAGLADGVCAAGGRPSGAVSHLWAAARVHRRHPAWRVRHRLYGLGSARHEADTRQAAGGESARGVVCLAVARWCPSTGRDSGLGGSAGPGLRPSLPRTGRLAGPVAGGMAWGCRGTNSIARRSTPVSGRIRTRSVQPSAIRSAQGRACVHRGALSPEHSR